MSEIRDTAHSRRRDARHRLTALNDASRNALSRRSRITPSAAVGARSAWLDARRWWFDALDDRQVEGGDAPWIARVVGIHEIRPHLWIQLESADTVRRVVLHVTLETRLDDALAAIAASSGDATGPELVDARRGLHA